MKNCSFSVMIVMGLLSLSLVSYANSQNSSPRVNRNSTDKPKSFQVAPASDVPDQVQIEVDLTNVRRNFYFENVAVHLEFYDHNQKRVGRDSIFLGTLRGGEKKPFQKTYQAPTKSFEYLRGVSLTWGDGRPVGGGDCPACLSIPATSTTMIPVGKKAQEEVASSTCLAGYVWREAVQGDKVCVKPETRKQVREENRLAPMRRNPRGGAYGTDTCLQGYVWREAVPEDHVCVLPVSHAQARSDNEQAAKRVRK